MICKPTKRRILFRISLCRLYYALPHRLLWLPPRSSSTSMFYFPNARPPRNYLLTCRPRPAFAAPILAHTAHHAWCAGPGAPGFDLPEAAAGTGLAAGGTHLSRRFRGVLGRGSPLDLGGARRTLRRARAPSLRSPYALGAPYGTHRPGRKAGAAARSLGRTAGATRAAGVPRWGGQVGARRGQ